MTTPIDRAHADMDAAPDDTSKRLAFFARLAEAELFLLLDRTPVGEAIHPRVFETDEGRFLVVFDTEERLADFAGSAPYAALSGRRLAGMAAGQELGFALNPDVAPSEFLMPPGALDWLAETLKDAPATAEARPEEVSLPVGLPEALLPALDAKLATMQGRARTAYLVGVLYEGGQRGHLLAFFGTATGADGALARAVQEALAFSGLDAARLDVGFFRDNDPIAERLARVGLRFDIPAPEAPAPSAPPGSDPDRPPRLK